MTVEDDEPHRISLELEDEDEEKEDPFVMETEELKSRMDKSHMPEAHPFEPEENAPWASRDPDVNDGDDSPVAAREDEETDDVAAPQEGDEERGDTGQREDAADPERVRQKAFNRVAEKLREKGRSEEWIEEHEDVIWDRVDAILTE